MANLKLKIFTKPLVCASRSIFRMLVNPLISCDLTEEGGGGMYVVTGETLEVRFEVTLTVSVGASEPRGQEIHCPNSHHLKKFFTRSAFAAQWACHIRPTCNPI